MKEHQIRVTLFRLAERNITETTDIALMIALVYRVYGYSKNIITIVLSGVTQMRM